MSGTPTSTGDVTISAGYGQDGQTGFTNQSPVTISVTAASAPPTPAASP